MVRKTKEEAERTYHALLDAATLLFIRQGVAKTTLNDIAIETGMTRGAIYWHFDNKDAVIRALWERNADKMHQTLSDMLTEVAPPHPARRFRLAIKKMVRSVVSKPEVGQVLRIVIHNVEFTDEQTELQRYLMSKKEELYFAMERAFDELKRQDALRVDLPPELLARSLMSYIHGLIHSYLSPGRLSLDLELHGDCLLDLFLDTLLRHQEKPTQNRIAN